MQKIKKNISAIQHKFQSLKEAHKMYDDPTPIGEAAEIMTYGVVRQQQVDEYLQYVHSSPQIQASHQINQNWFDLNIQQMILFLDKVIKYRNVNKPKQPGKKQRLNIVPYQRKKIRKSTNDAHQNPYIPPYIQGLGYIDENGIVYDQNGQIRKLNQNKQKQQSPYVSSNQDQQQRFPQKQEKQGEQGIAQQKTQKLNQKQSKPKQKISIQSVVDLPQDFKNYPVQQRFIILLTKYSRNKNQLEKKFNTIYTHYKKQMYIPHQTFKTNSELLMDLRIFLKYYKDFDISKKFRANLATSYFKKLAFNGIWLDFQNFTQLHYKLIQLLKINDKQLTLRLQNGQINDNKKSNQLKKQLSKNGKSIMQNLMKLKQLTDLISDQKIKKLLNDTTGKKIITKIVQVHSGLVKEDILLRLKQRIQQKKRKAFAATNYESQKLKKESPGKIWNRQQDGVRSNPHKLSVYQMLKIPNLGSRQMKKSSVYSSLELLNIHKQKQRLRQLINEQQNQKYLEAYFKKQKQLNSLFRSNSINLKRVQTQEQQSPKSANSKLMHSVKTQRNDRFYLKNSLSLPRMKFS